MELKLNYDPLGLCDAKSHTLSRSPPSPAPPSLTLGVPWGPDLGAGVQEHTGPDAIPTVTFAAAAGDLVTDPSQRGCGTEARSSEGLV